MRGKEKLWRQTWILPVLMLLMTAFLWRGVLQVNATERSEKAATGEETQSPTIEVTQYIDGKDFYNNNSNLGIGTTHTLSVKVDISDGSTPKYRWYDNNWKPIDNAIGNELEITKGPGNEVYYLDISTDTGGYTTCSFWLYPEDTLTVTQWIGEVQTSYAACQLGEKVTLEVKAESTYAPENITYQWQDSDWKNIEGENGNTFTIEKKEIGMENYHCEVSDGNNTWTYPFSVDSGDTLSYTLQINGEDYEESTYYPCTEDKTYTLSINANTTISDANIDYQWYEMSDNGSIPLEEKTTSTLTVDKPTGYKQYYCEMFDGNKWATAYFNLDLGDTLTIRGLTINGQDYEEYSYFSCTQDGDYRLKIDAISTLGDVVTYEWYGIGKDGYYVPIESAESAELVIDRPTKTESYYCRVSDGNKTYEKWFYLNLGETLSVKQYVDGDPYRQYTTLECAEDEIVQLEVQAKSSLGAEKITYDWFYYNEKNEYTPIEDDTSICNFLMKAGYYQIYCVVNDGNENETYYFYLTTAPTLSAEQYMNGHKGTNAGEFVKGEPIKLEVKASTTSGNDITYQWYNATWCDESAILSEEKNAVLNVTKDEASNNGYCCKVSDGIFTEECQFYINSKNTLSIKGFINDGFSDADVSFTEGEEITLRVEATSSYDNNRITYKWFKDVDGEMVELDTEKPTVCNVTKGSGTEYYECEVDDGNAKSAYSFDLYEDTESISVTCIPYIDGERYNSYYAEKYNCAVGQTLILRAEVLTEEDNVSRVWEYYDGDQDCWVKQEGTGESISVKVASEYDEYRCIITVGEEEYILYYDFYVRNTGGGGEPGEEEYTYLIPYVNGIKSSEVTEGIGETANLSVEVVNPPENVTYQWYKNRGSSDIGIKGANGDSYAYIIEEGVKSISCSVYTDGDYTFSITFYIADAYEEEEESTLSFTRYINNAEKGYIEYTPGEEVILEVKARSTTENEISYTWYDEDGVQIGTGTTYKFKPAGYQEIYCQLFDGVSYENAWFELEMQSTWSATQYIDGQEAEEKICAQDASVQLEMKVTGQPVGTLTYKWYNNKNKLQGEESVLEVTSGAKAETYRCIVSDGYQTKEYEFYLKPAGSISFDVVPYIGTEQTDEIYLDSGESTELKVDVSGTTEGITYHWYIFKGEGAYSPLGTSAVQKVTAGEYEGDYYLCVVRVGSVEKTAYFHVYVNKDSGEHIHQWDSGVITKQPTQTETGIKTYTCLTCGETKEEILDKLPSTTEDTKPTEPSSPTTQTKPSTQTPQKSPSAQTPAASPAPAIGATLVSSDKKTVYKVTGSNTVEYKKAGTNKAKVTIPSTVTYQGRKYQVTSIGAKAFKNNKKLKKVVIPSTVRKIGKQAFINCKKLKSITIKTNKLNAKAIGSKAFKGINAQATIKVPKKKLKLYKKILRAKGVSASVRIK